MPASEGAGKGRSRGRFQLLVVCLFALAGLLASGVWLWTAQEGWKGVMLQRQINLDRKISGERLFEVWKDLQGLDESLLPGRHVAYPALAGLLVILDESLPADVRTAVLRDAAASARNALAREPADASTWARLAWFAFLQKGPSPEVVSALGMSIYTAPSHRRLMNWRIEMAARNRAFWNDGFENLVRRQIQNSWEANPDRLAQAVLTSGLVPMAREVLAHDPEGSKRLDELLSRHG